MPCSQPWAGATDVLSFLPAQGMTVDDFKKFIAVDKKVLDGQLRLILLKGALGGCVFTGDFQPSVLEDVLAAYC